MRHFLISSCSVIAAVQAPSASVRVSKAFPFISLLGNQVASMPPSSIRAVTSAPRVERRGHRCHISMGSVKEFAGFFFFFFVMVQLPFGVAHQSKNALKFIEVRAIPYTSTLFNSKSRVGTLCLNEITMLICAPPLTGAPWQSSGWVGALGST